MKNELRKITKAKFQALIKILYQYEIDPDSDNDNLPSHHDIAKALEYKVPRACKLLKDLHIELTSDFMCNSLDIEDYVHVIRLDFLYLKDFIRGYVHSVEHEIDGIQQKIYHKVHPIHHEYYR